MLMPNEESIALSESASLDGGGTISVAVADAWREVFLHGFRLPGAAHTMSDKIKLRNGDTMLIMVRGG